MFDRSTSMSRDEALRPLRQDNMGKWNDTSFFRAQGGRSCVQPSCINGGGHGRWGPAIASLPIRLAGQPREQSQQPSMLFATRRACCEDPCLPYRDQTRKQRRVALGLSVSATPGVEKVAHRTGGSRDEGAAWAPSMASRQKYGGLRAGTDRVDKQTCNTVTVFCFCCSVCALVDVRAFALQCHGAPARYPPQPVRGDRRPSDRGRASSPPASALCERGPRRNKGAEKQEKKRQMRGARRPCRVSDGG